ncbi:YlaI family protein [Alkalibacillus aidingensis]|uniref:YlaI family protein n=1 Tax=Alkalibacillus aidingensis TaxID=2747607 RepID=UPI0016612A2C|nr:YlaI family protein [Alkalibacillus aidingensis]
MRVKCVLCDQTDQVESFSLLAKQLRKRRKLSYLCDACHDRIANKTNERKKSSEFKLYEPEKEDDYIK